MRSGPMRHRVILQQLPSPPSQDSAGQEMESWQTVDTVWAEILPASGQERFLAGGEQRQASVIHRVRLRPRADLSAEMRLLWGSRVLTIESIQDPSGRGAETLLLCREVLT